MLNNKHIPHKQSGFTLIEVMIAVVIIGILASIAYPSYTKYVTRTYRDSAKACLSEYAHAMERRYSATLSYVGGLPQLDCATASNLDTRYTFTFKSESLENLKQDEFTVQAKPKLVQAAKEKDCGTMSIDQKGQRLPATGCW